MVQEKLSQDELQRKIIIETCKKAIQSSKKEIEQVVNSEFVEVNAQSEIKKYLQKGKSFKEIIKMYENKKESLKSIQKVRLEKKRQ